LRGDAPGLRHARLDRAACDEELAVRGIPYVPASDTEGVAMPIRLQGPIHGVSIHSELPATRREADPIEIFDCRLVVALDDFAALVAELDIVEIIHMSAFRPAKSNGCLPASAGKQHCAALAVDVGAFVRKDGSNVKVERDFHGRIGAPTCIAGVGPRPPTPAAKLLRDIVCESAARATFNIILTPNFNREHRNHLHLEITPDVDWMLVK
jgi:hypothetical protein